MTKRKITKPAVRSTAVLSSLAMDILNESRYVDAQSRKINHLELGVPDFPTPDNVLFSAKRVVEVDPDTIMITMGSSPAMPLAFGALPEPGDEVIIPNPHYPPYPNNINFTGGIPVKFDLDESDGFQNNIDKINHKITIKNMRNKRLFCV